MACETKVRYRTGHGCPPQAPSYAQVQQLVRSTCGERQRWAGARRPPLAPATVRHRLPPKWAFSSSALPRFSGRRWACHHYYVFGRVPTSQCNIRIHECLCNSASPKADPNVDPRCRYCPEETVKQIFIFTKKKSIIDQFHFQLLLFSYSNLLL